MIGFLVGIVFGGAVGVTFMCLVTLASWDDDRDGRG